MLPLVVIDIARRAKSNPDTVVDGDDLRQYERRYGRIPDGALVAMDSGWAKKIGDEAAYKGGPAGGYHFPGFGDDAIAYLLQRRKAAAIGVDTLSLDNGPSSTFSVHVNWLNALELGLNNLANLDKVPRSGATAIVGVIPWQEGSGGPARVPRPTSAGTGGRPVALDDAPRRMASGRMGRAGRLVRPGRRRRHAADRPAGAGRGLPRSAGERAVAILITIPYHTRSAEALSERYGAKIYGYPAVAKRLRKASVEPIDGELPGGARAFPIGKTLPRDAYLLALDDALAFGDAIVTTPDGELRVWHFDLVDEEAHALVPRALRADAAAAARSRLSSASSSRTASPC